MSRVTEIGWIAGAMLACCAGAWIVVYVATGMLAHR